MDVDTGTLRALTVLAEELHFGRSAGRLGITQQAVSKRIARLEALTGAAVVDRSDRRTVRLTDYGRRLADAAREVLEAADRLPTAAEDGAGTIRVDSASCIERMGPVCQDFGPPRIATMSLA